MLFPFRFDRGYLLASVFLLSLGVAILYDLFPWAFVRGFAGDVLVVMFLYCLVRTLFRYPVKVLAPIILSIAFGVEFFQIFVDSQSQSLLQEATIGSTFDPHDLLAYAIGVATIATLDHKTRKQESD